jgi:hypothetical protein
LIPLGRSRPSRSSRSPRHRSLLSVLVAAVVAGCLGAPAASVAPIPSTAVVTTAPDPSAAAPSSAVTASPSASTTPTDAISGPLAGQWRVRRALAVEDRSVLLPGAAFAEEAFRIVPSCSAEPCASIEVQATPIGRSRPVTTTTLERDGDRYASTATAVAAVPCRNTDGDQVPGGADATSTLRLWLASVRPSGSAVETVGLQGVLELALTPTPIGRSAGCEPDLAVYDLSGKRGAVAVMDRPRTGGDIPAGVATVPLPDIDASIRGADVDYFEVEGTTVDELMESVGRGALRACGGIDYEWLDGDNTPAACTITAFPDIASELEERTDGDGECRIESNATIRFTVHLPRWSGPDRVPARMIDWWRETVLFIRDHEAEHVRISLDHAVGLDERLDGAACDAVDRIVRNWVRILGEAQESFDRREYARPWPEAPAGA